MKSELAKFNYTFREEVSIPNDISVNLIEGETAIGAYKTFRDVAIITNKRLIIKDSQGIRGKKIEMYTIPFKSINMYSVETAGKIDINTEIELWTRSGHIKIKLGKKVDIMKIEKIISTYVL